MVCCYYYAKGNKWSATLGWTFMANVKEKGIWLVYVVSSNLKTININYCSIGAAACFGNRNESNKCCLYYANKTKWSAAGVVGRTFMVNEKEKGILSDFCFPVGGCVKKCVSRANDNCLDGVMPSWFNLLLLRETILCHRLLTVFQSNETIKGQKDRAGHISCASGSRSNHFACQTNIGFAP